MSHSVRRRTFGCDARWQNVRVTEIRRATADDALDAAAVFTRSRRDAGDSIPPAIHTPAEDARFVRDVLIAQRETWVAVDRGTIVGLLTLHDDWLDQLYIASAAQGAGLGTRFVELAKQQRPTGLQLWAFASNLPAQSFYERHGFVEAERTDGSGNEEKAPDIRYLWSGR